MWKHIVLLLVLLTACISFAKAQQHTLAADINRLHPACYLNMNEAGGNFHDYGSGMDWLTQGPGVIQYRQAGFDITNPKKFSAVVPFDASIKAPNNSLCDLDRNQVWDIAILIDKLNFPQYLGKQQTLIAKGVFPSAGNYGVKATDPGAIGWALVLNFVGYTQLCFEASARGVGGYNYEVCSNNGQTGAEGLTNGYRHFVTIHNDGTGSGSSLTMTINGSQSYVGGGNLRASMSTATSCPLMISGDCTNKLMSAGTNLTTIYGPMQVDTVAVFKGGISEADRQQLWLDTKWYQDPLGARPAVPQLVIYDNGYGTDADNHVALALLTQLHKLGYVKIVLVNSAGLNPSDPVYVRVVNGLSGIGHVTVSQSSDMKNYETGGASGYISAYTSELPPLGSYSSDVIGLHNALASIPMGQCATYIIGGPYSSLQRVIANDPTLFASKVCAVRAQGGNDNTANYTNHLAQYYNEGLCLPCGSSVFGSLTTLGKPFYLRGNTASTSGPGLELTRGARDPLSLVLVGNNSTTRQLFDSLPVIGLVAPSLLGVMSQGTYTLSTDGIETWTVSPSGTMFELGYPVPNPHLSSWFVNSLVGVPAQPSMRLQQN